jgi:hypothetical protein
MGPCCIRRKQINNLELTISIFLKDAKNGNINIGSEGMFRKAIDKILANEMIEEIAKIYTDSFKYFDHYDHDDYGECYQYVLNIDDAKQIKYMCFIFITKKDENNIIVELFPSKAFE